METPNLLLQEKICDRKIAVVGLGAIGSRVSEFLARMGFRKLLLIDRDFISHENLRNCSLYTEKDVMERSPKAAGISKYLKKINKRLRCKFHVASIGPENIEILNKADLILDCTDNLSTRFLLNEYCIRENLPLIYSAALKSKFMGMNIIPKETPCLKCVLNVNSEECERCEDSGIIPQAASFIALHSSLQAVKILSNAKYEKRLLYGDILNFRIDFLKIKNERHCKVCAKKEFDFLNWKKAISMCGSEKFHIVSKTSVPLNLMEVAKVLGENSRYNKFLASDEKNKIVIFKDGRAIIKAKAEKEALNIYENVMKKLNQLNQNFHSGTMLK